MKVAVDVTWLSVDHRGMGRYVASILSNLLDRSDLTVTLSARDVTIAGAVADRLQRTLPPILAWDDPKLASVDVCWFPWNRIDKPPATTRVVTIHDTAMVDWPVTGHAFAWLDNRKMKAQLTRAVKQAHRIMVPSQFTRGRLLNLYGNLAPESIEVVSEGHRGLSIPRDSPRPAGLDAVCEPFVLHVGGSDPRKNVVGLLQAWPQLQTESQLVMAGLSPSENVPPNVLCLGPVGDEALQWLYGRATATVIPSLYEGFGLPLLEAMAAGSAVVSSCASSLPEVGADVPEYFDPKDPSDMARALAAVLGNAERAAAIRTRGVERAREFTWERATQQVVDCLTRAHQTRRRGHASAR